MQCKLCKPSEICACAIYYSRSRWVAVLDNKQIEVATSNCLSSCSIRPRGLPFATGVAYSETYHFVCARPTYLVFVRVETIYLCCWTFMSVLAPLRRAEAILAGTIWPLADGLALLESRGSVRRAAACYVVCSASKVQYYCYLLGSCTEKRYKYLPG